MNRTYSRTFAVITASMYFMILAGCGGGDSGPTSPSPTSYTDTAGSTTDARGDEHNGQSIFANARDDRRDGTTDRQRCGTRATTR